MSNKTTVCRVCLESEQNKYISLFVKYKHYSLFEYINAITSIEIKHRDGFPDKICESCYQQLQTAINFKEKCETSNITLQNSYLKDELYSDDVADIKIKREKCEENNIKVENENNDNFLNFDHFSEDNDDRVLDIIYEPINVPKSKSKDRNVECHDCGGIFKSKCKLRVHWKKVHMLESLICPDCKRTFKSYRALHIHKKKKTKSCRGATNSNICIEGLGKTRVFNCKVCGYKTRRVKDMTSHQVIHSGERPFQCNLCPNTYTQYSSLQGHKEGAHKDYVVEITCHICGKYIRGRRNVYRHLKNHKDEKVTCTVCKKVMNQRSYHVHMKRHSGVKSYTCEKCASTFYTSAELCNHKRWVHDKKNNKIKCVLCDYKCSKAYKVRQHQLKHTGNNLPCTFCGRFFISAEKLSAHAKSHYEEKKYSCPQCDLKFYNRDSVRKHMKSKHSLTIINNEQKIVSVEVKKEKVIVIQNEDVIVEIDPKPID